MVGRDGVVVRMGVLVGVLLLMLAVLVSGLGVVSCRSGPEMRGTVPLCVVRVRAST